MKRAIITQSNYIPWKGYFDSIAAVDTFVVYDDMQYTKRDWRNRNIIKTPTGLRWLSIPVEVKGKYYQKIKDTRIADSSWPNNHWNIIKEVYGKSLYFREMATWVEPLYKNCTFEFLTDVNLHFIRAINSFFCIDTEILLSSAFSLHGDRNHRLVDICKKLGISDYYSGPTARDYIDEGLFNKEQIKIHFWDFSAYPEYHQPYPPFEHGVSILDLIFCEGYNAVKYMKLHDKNFSS